MKKLNRIDTIIEEPLGGAHRNSIQMAAELKIILLQTLEELNKLSLDELLERRYRRLLSYGVFKE
ncbi:MAG: hypothetical protein U1F76_19035 [Candidatus Competibacteraceae bacterium]